MLRTARFSLAGAWDGEARSALMNPPVRREESRLL